MKLLLGFGAALLATSAVCSPKVAVSQAKRSAPTSADSQLAALYNGYASWDAKESGYFENGRGEVESSGYLTHVDAASQLRRAAHMKELLEQLDEVPKGKLSPDEQVNAAVFRTLLENSVSEARFRTWEMPFNSDSSFWTYLDASQSFDGSAGYRRYIATNRSRLSSSMNQRRAVFTSRSSAFLRIFLQKNRRRFGPRGGPPSSSR